LEKMGGGEISTIRINDNFLKKEGDLKGRELLKSSSTIGLTSER